MVDSCIFHLVYDYVRWRTYVTNILTPILHLIMDLPTWLHRQGCRKWPSVTDTSVPSKHNYRRGIDIHPTLTSSAGYRSGVDPSTSVCRVDVDFISSKWRRHRKDIGLTSAREIVIGGYKCMAIDNKEPTVWYLNNQSVMIRISGFCQTKLPAQIKSHFANDILVNPFRI